MRSLQKYHFDSALSVLLGATLLFYFGQFATEIRSTVLLIVSLIGLLPVVWGAYRSFRDNDWASMDLLASIALVFSLIGHEFVSAVFIELMLAAARILDDITRDRTEKSIRGLLKLRPETATVEYNGALTETRIEHIHVGDIVVVDIGERIPVDGIIISGTAAVDESSLTGESTPVDKKEGNRAMSSTLVQSGNIRIKTTHTGKDTTLERVIRLVESAREEKPNAQTLGERFGKFYLIFIFIGSIALYAITHNLPLVLSVVLVVCADDIAVAIPIAYLRTIRTAASLGVIVKGSKHLEVLGKTDTVVFDKTGTLTTGKLVVSKIVAAPNYREEDVLRIGVFAATRSTHPLSRAFVLYAQEHGYAEQFPDTVEERSGKGVIAKKGTDTIVTGRRAFLTEIGEFFPPELIAAADTDASKGHSILFVSLNGTVVGFAAALDHPKENAASSLAALRALGVKKMVMLTGDNEHVAETVAREIGIDMWHANLLPEDKVAIVRDLERSGHVAMVGDGVNDAAALSIASVGIAMGGLGTEGAIESAEIVLMRDDLSALPAIICLAHTARSVSIQDFWIWGITNSLGLALVFAGIIGPPGAAAYNFLSDFLPLFNSLRIHKPR